MLMHKVRVSLMLCSEMWRLWEQQLLQWHGAKQRAREVLCSNQPEGLATTWQRCMLCSVCRGQRLRPHHRSRV